jgi:phage-related protein
LAQVKRVPAFFYRTASGAEPVRRWLKNLPAEDRRILGVDIATVEYGWPVGMPVCSPITSRRGLWEVRSTLLSGRIARVLFCIHGGRMVLLHGFIKKTQQTPDRDLDMAMKRKKEIER